MSKRSPDLNARYRSIETSINLTVIAAERRPVACQVCGIKGLAFNCHLFRATPPRIVELCKACAVEAAGGEDKVWVRTGEYLRRLWAGKGRAEQPASLRSALLQRQSQRVQAEGQADVSESFS